MENVEEHPFRSIYEVAALPVKERTLLEQARLSAYYGKGRTKSKAREAKAAAKHSIATHKEKRKKEQAKAKRARKVETQSAITLKRAKRAILKRAARGYKTVKFTKIRWWYRSGTKHEVVRLLEAEGFEVWTPYNDGSNHRYIDIDWTEK